MKKYSKRLEKISDQIYFLLDNNKKVLVKDFGWENHVWNSHFFSWAHLEKFCTDKVSVLHCVIMPHSNSSAPIYGFDVIEISGHLTGMFLDLTSVDGQQYPIQPVGQKREVPDWADFFSPYFICCKPEEKDLQSGVDVLKDYLKLLPSLTNVDYRPQQQSYINGQRRNPQTFKMLKSHIGKEKAAEFIEQILFPNV